MAANVRSGTLANVISGLLVPSTRRVRRRTEGQDTGGQGAVHAPTQTQWLPRIAAEQCLLPGAAGALGVRRSMRRMRRSCVMMSARGRGSFHLCVRYAGSAPAHDFVEAEEQEKLGE